MNKKIITLASLLSIFFFYPAFAAKKTLPKQSTEPATDTLKEFQFDGDTIHAVVPAGWTAMVGTLNVPVAMVSERGTQNQRGVIEITPYGVTSEKDGFAKLKDDPENFYDQKETWLEKTAGESISYIPFQEQKKDGAKIYSIGIKYRTMQGTFLDKTYFVSSKSNQLYSIKLLMPLDLEKENDVAVNKVIESVSARN